MWLFLCLIFKENSVLKLIETDSNDTHFQTLIDVLDEELNDRYGRPFGFKNDLNEIPFCETVILVKKDSEFVACGCFKEYDKLSVELKRVFVKKKFRGQGISKVLVNKLEDWAVSLGYSRFVLETGVNQPEAISLYKKLRYQVIKNFPPYVGHELSICMEKNA